MRYFLKIASAEFFVKITVLHRFLTVMRVEIIVFHFRKLADHAVFGNVKQSVKMQSLFFGGAFPNAYIFPAFSETQHFKAVFQFFAESFFGMLFIIESECAEKIEFLQVYLPEQALFTA